MTIMKQRRQNIFGNCVNEKKYINITPMGEEVAVTSCHLHLERIIHGIPKPSRTTPEETEREKKKKRIYGC
ncbi:hypothetical protein OUZ56_030678 [Daphnia magna]|uniref:Uncharacterized protein n=1 Tax=Daphnia magna TaxID=35525 RepID=A0ABQ9ZS14_9CRUS|nr:hypothetical protein OUZ56_030678 [Daphnia magna]